MIKQELNTSMLPEMTPTTSSGLVPTSVCFLLNEHPSWKFFFLSRFVSVQFRTTPMDSTGVPHILEHTVLCGSEKYPCRDPFFKMLNRSLSTFMNAFTGTQTFQKVSPQTRFIYFLTLCLLVCSCSQWLHHVSLLDAKWEGFPESAVCLPGCSFLPLFTRARFQVRI